MTENAYHKIYTLCATWMKHVFNQSTERNSLYFLAGKKFTLLWQVLDKGNVPFPLPLTTEPEVSMVIFHCPLPVAVDLCSSASAPSKWFSAVITHCTRRHIFGFWVFFVQSSNYYVNERMAIYALQVLFRGWVWSVSYSPDQSSVAFWGTDAQAWVCRSLCTKGCELVWS